MKKYFAKELDSEYFDAGLYISEEELINNLIWIGGNRHFITMNEDFKQDILESLEAYDSTLASMEEEVNLSAVTYREVASHYFNKCGAETVFSDNDMRLLTDAREEYYRNENEAVCKVLEVIYGEPFETGYLRGCCQSDWVEYICPTNAHESLEYIEAAFFNTGKEFTVSEEKLESVEELDNAECLNYFTSKWSAADVRADLARQVGCEPDELVILQISEVKTIKKYEYEEI